ncbi:MAG: HEAT repeat domain-containing protein, partial [Cyanobacteria bacterium P01_H01_bin.130]
MKATDDTALLNFDEAFESPLDQLSDADSPLPNADEMLALLDSSDSEERIVAARAFCELEEERAIAPLIQLLDDPCALVRVSAAYALGRNISEAAIAALVDRYDREWNG